MKNMFLSSSRYQRAARGLLLGCAFLLVASASAQNRLQNPGFESPLDPWDPLGLSGGKTNWTVVFVSGGPGSFAMNDRSTESARSGGRGAHFRQRTESWCHAYFTQTVSNLTAGANYIVSGYINISWVSPKLRVYFESLGGAVGTTSVVSPDVAATGWIQYSVTNTASASGKLEVRLHSDKQQTVSGGPGLAKFVLTDARFDDFSLTPQ